MENVENKKMVVFGTLFNGEMGGIKDILIILGKGKKVIEIDRKFQEKKLFSPWGLKKLGRLFKGISKKELRNTALDYCSRNLIDGIKDISIVLKKKGFIVGVLSSNPQFMMDILKEMLPLDFAIGLQLEFKDGIATGRIMEEFNRYKKAEILKKKREEYGIEKENTIFISRASVTHLPMTKETKFFLGFDPEKENIREMFGISNKYF